MLLFIALCGIHAWAAPSPVLTAPTHITKLNASTAVLDHAGDYYMCFEVSFANTGTFTSTHWSAYVGVSGVTSISSIYTGNNIQLNVVYPGVSPEYVYAEIYSASFNAAVSPSDTLTLGLCVDKPGPSVTLSTIDLRGGILYSFGVSALKETPLTYTSPLVTYHPESNQCLPEWHADLLDWDVLARDLAVTSSSLGGRIAVEGDALLSELWNPVGQANCAACSTGALAEASIVAHDFLEWTSGQGMCGGYFQGVNDTSDSPVLDTVEAPCPRVTGSNPLDYSAMYSSLASVSRELATKPATGHTGHSSGNGNILTLWLRDVPDTVFHVPEGVFTSSGVRVELLHDEFLKSAEVIVINIAGSSVYLTSVTLSALTVYKTKVLLNCYEATRVDVVASVVMGTLLAPLARVVAGAGSAITGAVFADELQGANLQLVPSTWRGLANAGTCVSCIDGHYGQHCLACDCAYNQDCADTVHGSGECTCKPGWNAQCDECDATHHGPLCESACSEACLAHGSCSTGVNGTGACSDCDEHWTGDQCHTCTPGRYGPHCASTCTDSCLARGQCDQGPQGDGSCTCHEGWAGPQCDVCDEGHYGDHCQYACVDTCALYGECDHGFNGTGECLSCDSGFTGDNCEACVGDHWGSQCASPCNTTCLMRGVCDTGPSGTGLCSDCDQGYGGDQCHECARGYYGNRCQYQCHESCVTHGYCVDGFSGLGCVRCFQKYAMNDDSQCMFTGAASTAPVPWLLLVVLALYCLY